MTNLQPFYRDLKDPEGAASCYDLLVAETTRRLMECLQDSWSD